MSLGLKEVLSINTDFVSRKDEKLTGNDKPFSEMNDSEIKKVAEALMEQEIASLGLSKVEDLSKEAQTIFSDIVAWMLERKMRDHEGTIAKDNENAEWWESIMELTASVVSTLRSFEPFFQNKEYRKEYRKRFLSEKIKEKEVLLKKYAQTELPPLNAIEQDKCKIEKGISSLNEQIKENDGKLEKYGLDLEFLESVEKGFAILIEELKEILEDDSQAKTKKDAKYETFETLLQNSESINLQSFIRECLTKSKEMKEKDCLKSDLITSNIRDNYIELKPRLCFINDYNTDIFPKLEKNCEGLKLNEKEIEKLDKEKLDKEIDDIDHHELNPLNNLSNDVNNWFNSNPTTTKYNSDKKEEFRKKFLSGTQEEKLTWVEMSQKINDSKLRNKLHGDSATSLRGCIEKQDYSTDYFQKTYLEVKEIIRNLIEEKNNTKEKFKDKLDKLDKLQKEIESLKESNGNIKTGLINKVNEAIEKSQKEITSIIDKYKLKIRKSESDLNTTTDGQKQKKLPELKSHLTILQETIQHIKELEGKLPWTTNILSGSSGSNTIYKIEYILGGGEPPIVIEEFSYPTQKSVRSRNAAVAKRLILLLLAQKPVEEEDKTESKLSQNTPDLAEVVKQIAFLVKTGVRVYKTSQTSSNGRKKRAFDRAADCYGAIPVVLRATLASLEAGFKFNRDKQREAIK